MLEITLNSLTYKQDIDEQELYSLYTSLKEQFINNEQLLYTLLEHCVYRNYISVVQQIIRENKIDSHYKENYFFKTACEKNYINLLKLFLDYSKTNDADKYEVFHQNFFSNDCAYALKSLSMNECKEVVEFIVSQGFIPEKTIVESIDAVSFIALVNPIKKNYVLDYIFFVINQYDNFNVREGYQYFLESIDNYDNKNEQPNTAVELLSFGAELCLLKMKQKLEQKLTEKKESKSKNKI